MGYKGENLKSISYEFPFLEYMMFIEICELKVSESVGLKDILHLIYAKGPLITFFVSHDAKLCKVVSDLKSNGYYSVEGITAKELVDRFI